MHRLLILLLLLLPSRAHSETGWSPGVVASGMAEAFATTEPVPVTLPASIAALVTGPTFLLYYSPTCPHCQAVVPEINALIQQLDEPLYAVASGSSSPEQIAEFVEVFGVEFDTTTVDTDREFAAAMGARSTPTLYLLAPAPEEASAPFVLLEAYTPFTRGMGAVVAMRRSPDSPFAHFDGYQGDTVCATCHRQESLSWMLTHHAQAYYTLYQRNRAEDMQCVGCHVTGMGEPGGFVIGDHRSPMSAVTCEACHGPSGPHDGQRTDATQRCVRCHDPDHSVAFTVEKGLPHIDHFLANGMAPEELKARVLAISDGSAARPLLAFPDGPTAGSATCKSCHKSEHKAMKKGPHAQAMSLLEGEDAAAVACVRCHATATRSGPPPDTLEGYRLEDGVGCESCHGPGSAHAAAPTADNIVGLGDSCPECVIEAICTSCHTLQWDPGWELKERLKATSH